MKNIIILIILCTIAISCKKYNRLKDEDLSGKPSYVYGRLFLTDTLTQDVLDQPLPGKTITISFNSSADTLNYLLSTTTDKDGYFRFSPLASGQTYRLNYAETVSGALYTAEYKNVEVPNDKFVMGAALSLNGQRGIVFTITDSLGRRLKGADICIFSSPIPYNSMSCDGSIYSLKSDANGHASQFGMKAETYYYISKISINGSEYIQKGTFNIAKRVEQMPVKLILPSNPPTNTLNISLVDQQGSSVANGRVCLFTSKILFARDTCENSNYSVVTNVLGKATLTNMAPGKYYILGDVSLPKLKLLAKDSLTITDKAVNLTLHLK